MPTLFEQLPLGLDRIVKAAMPLCTGIAMKAVFFAALTLIVALYTHEGVHYGPTWFRDYGLYGMQYGAQQIFSAIRKILENESQSRFALSTSWANGADVFVEFFLPSNVASRIQGASVDAILRGKVEASSQRYVLLTRDEYNQIRWNDKIKTINRKRFFRNPDDSIGFHLLTIEYVHDIDLILAGEAADRLKLLPASIVLGGQEVKLKHSLLDIGEAGNMFDGDNVSLARGYIANPFIVELEFATPRLLSGVRAVLGHAPYYVKLELSLAEQDEAIRMQKEVSDSPAGNVSVEFEMQQPAQFVSGLKLALYDLRGSSGYAKVRVREITLLP